MKSKFIGCLVGSAVGDALGSTFEGFLSLSLNSESFFGRWTDDTHMMIGVAESLIANRGFEGNHMARTFIENYEQEPWRGYASGPPKVFRWIKSGVAWNEAAKQLFGGTGSFGNGAAMRVAPVGLFYYDNMEKLRATAYSQSQITHTHELGMEGAALQAYAVALAVKTSPSCNFDPHAFLAELKNFTNNEVYRMKLERMRKLLADAADKSTVVRKLGNGVEAHNSVPTAIYCFLHNWSSFEGSIRYAISLGGDADTIAAMTGAISGAYHGVEAIPERWRNKLERKEYIENLAEKLWEIRRKAPV